MARQGMKHSSSRMRVDQQIFNQLTAEQVTALFALLTDQAALDALLTLIGGMTSTGAEIDAVVQPPEAREVIPTADGLTTGLITATDRWLTFASANADHIATLPPIADVPLGHVIEGMNGATAFELRTPATSNTTINGTDADNTESVIAASAYVFVQKISATGWRLVTQVASTIASPVPD